MRGEVMWGRGKRHTGEGETNSHSDSDLGDVIGKEGNHWHEHRYVYLR
jgi:hypothetical protein